MKGKREETAGAAWLWGLTAAAVALTVLAAVWLGPVPAALVLLAAALLALLVRKDRQLRELKTAAETDPVTGIGNYAYLECCFQQAVHDKTRCSVLHFSTNTDHIRRVGGSEEANAFLRYTAQVLGEHVEGGDALARTSDSGFVLLRRGGSPEEARHLAELALEQLRAYARQFGKSFRVEAYAGVYHLEHSDRDLRTCVLKAEQSGRYARDNGLDCVECSRTIIDLSREDQALQERVATAFEEQEFELYLHFFVNARTKKIVGAEALSRWRHPEKGLLLPERYMPLLEREQTVSELDHYMLERVCRFLEKLWARHGTGFFISCNISRDTFSSPEFAGRCTAIIERYHFPREMLILELTESGVTNEAAMVYQNALDLKALGVSIVLDDFGTGYATISDLLTFQFDGLKLDKSFVDHLTTRDGQIIMQGIVEMMHRLGLTVLAEGVETEEQMRQVVELHCDAIQGFYFHKPLPLPEALDILLEQPETLPHM